MKMVSGVKIRLPSPFPSHLFQSGTHDVAPGKAWEGTKSSTPHKPSTRTLTARVATGIHRES